MGQGYYLFSCSIVNKASQSVVAMASYRSDEKLYSERDGLTKNYKNHDVKPESFILAPEHAPSWATDREKLWNEVERFEIRDSSQLARNVLLGLPNDMNNEQQLELVKEYVQDEFIDDGMVADVSIHRDDEKNPHAHVLLTVRAFDKEGNWEKSKSKRQPILDQEGNQMYNAKGWRMTRSIKINDWDSKDKLVQWRGNWSSKLNEKSKEFDLNKEYNHESYEKQNLEIKPTIHLTRNEYQFEERMKDEASEQGKEYIPQTFYAKKNEGIKKYNQEINNVYNLEDHKTKKDYIKILADSRRNIRFTPEEHEQLQLVVDRAKGYVDYGVAKKLHNDFHDDRNKWKLKIERQYAEIKSLQRVYDKVITGFKEEPKSVLKYGYTVDEFKKEMALDLTDLERKESIMQDEYNKYTELKKATAVSLGLQERLTNQEFIAIYGVEFEKGFTPEEKYFATREIIHSDRYMNVDEIKPSYKAVKGQQDFNQYVPIWKQAKDAMVSVDIYKRSISKFKNINRESIEGSEYKKELVKAQSMVILKDNYEKYLTSVEPLLNQEIKRNIGLNNIDLDTIKVPVKIAMLETYSKLSESEKQNLNEKEFMNDIATEFESKEKAMQEKLSQKYENEDEFNVHNDVANRTSEISNGLFLILNELQRANQQEHSRSKNRTKNQFRRKGMDGREL